MNLAAPDREALLRNHRPYEVVAGAADSRLLIICDHASNFIPAPYGGLGLPLARLQEHIAYDIGAANVARRLAAMTDSTAVLCGTSRLLIDCNRLFEDPSLIPEASDGVDIPGNRGLDPAEREYRANAFFHSYHGAVEVELHRRLSAGIVPAVVSVHSFTPRMNGQDRPWDVGLLWQKDPRMAPPLIDYLRREAGLCVGDNEPYSGVAPKGYAITTYGTERGLPVALFEIRQDQVETEAQADRWANILHDALAHVLQDESIFKLEPSAMD